MMDGNAHPRSQPESLLSSLRTQANVIGALLMRELHTRYGRENVGYLWMFLEPMTLASAVSVLHAGQKTHYGSDIQMVPFAMLGYSLFIMLRGMITRAEGALESNRPLLYHRSVTIFDMLFARALLEGAGTFVTYLVLITFAVIFDIAEFPARPLDIIIGSGLMFWFSFSVSMLICALTHENRLAGRLVHPIMYISMPLSGAFFQLSWIPEPYQSWLWWSPLMQIFEELRYGQFDSAPDKFVNLPYIVAWCLVMTWGGLVSIKIVRRHVHLN
jgi:capsular polysaccharide transport system permease protein